MVLPLGDLEKTRIIPLATYTLIALNVVMYVVQLGEGPDFTTALAATPFEITHWHDIERPITLPVDVGEESPDGDRDAAVRPVHREIRHAAAPFPVLLTLLTSMFLHGSPLHLAGNMLYLWIFGDNVEEVLGTVRYVMVYLACGVMGTLLQVAAAPDSMIPTLGASGAIAGVMGAYVVWFPNNRVRVLFFRIITVVPALWVIGLWIAMQLWLGFGSLNQIGESGGVAYLAHIGGAATGVLVAFLFRDRARQLEATNDYRDGWFVGPP
jgi:membrane associated rhomboid family serine protease